MFTGDMDMEKRLFTLDILRDGPTYIARIADTSGNVNELKGTSAEELLEQVSEALMEMQEAAPADNAEATK